MSDPAGRRLYVDASVLIEYPPLRDLRWRELFPKGRVVLIISHWTFEEFDKFKDAPGGSRPKRDRARIGARDLDALLFGEGRTGAAVEIQAGISVEYDDARVPPDIYAEHDLDPDLGDHRFLAYALAAKRRKPDGEVGVVAADGGAKRTAVRKGLTAYTPPGDRVKDPPDPLEIEVRELKKRLAAHEARRPELVLRRSDREPVTELSYWAPIPKTAEEIEQRMKRIERRVRPFSREAELQRAKMNVLTDAVAGIFGMGPPSEEDIRAYESKRQEFLRDMEKALPALIDHHNAEDRHHEFGSLEVANDGTMPAEGVVVELRLPPPLSATRKLPDDVQRPRPPEYPRPRERFLSSIEAFERYAKPAYGAPVVRAPFFERMGAPAPRWKIASEGNRLTFEVGKVQHERAVQLPAFLLILGSYPEAASFEIDFSIYADNTLTATSGTLGVRLEKLLRARPTEDLGCLEPARARVRELDGDE